MKEKDKRSDSRLTSWIPAFARMTGQGSRDTATMPARASAVPWRRWARNAALTAAAAASLGLLALLVDRSQGVATADRTAVQEGLRLVHQHDSDWNVGVMSAKVGLGDSYDALVLPLQRIAATLKDIDAAQARHGEPLKAELAALRRAFARKAELVDDFKSHNAVLRNSLRYLPASANEAREALRELPGQQGGSAEDVRAGVGDTLEQAARYALIPDADQQQRLAAAIEALDERLHRLPEPSAARDALANFLNHARTVLRQVREEGRLLADVVHVPVVDAIDRTNDGLETFFTARAAEAEAWRQALVAYSAVLLVLVAWAAWRLRHSYRQIRSMNAALRESNDLLEHRVEERTRELAEALRSLRESESQLIQSEKMSSLGQMVAGVVHEINTPLAYVRSSLETVGDQLMDVEDLVRHNSALLAALAAPEPDPDALARHHASASALVAAFEEHAVVPELRQLAADGLHGLDQIGELVVNLKNFSRLDRSKTTLFDLHEGLESTLVIARHVLKAHQVIKRYGEIPRVECSPSQLNQVFLNLVTNAAQAIGERHGTIVITTSVDRDDVRIDVADDGCGIAPEHRTRIFDPFFTTKAIGQGTGLGLAIVFRIVQEHGGRIDVASTVGRGTTFSVWLPAAGGAGAIELDSLEALA